MSRYVKTDQLIRDLTGMKDWYDAISLDGIIRALEERAVDAVEVIRCKDCQHSTVMGFKLYCGGRFSFAAYAVVTDDDFCSKAERKQNDELREI